MTARATSDRPEVGPQELLLVSEDIGGFLDAFTTAIGQALSADGQEVWCAATRLRPKRSTTVASSSAEPRPWTRSSTTTVTAPA